MREKPSRFECNTEPQTRDLNTELVATAGPGSGMCYALSFGGIDDAGIEEVLEMHLEAVSTASRKPLNLSQFGHKRAPGGRQHDESSTPSGGHTIAIVSIPSSFLPSVRSICT